jgi:hypothetical protein
MCSGEADSCLLPGTKRMAHGANTAFRYKTETFRASCNNGSFGGRSHLRCRQGLLLQVGTATVDVARGLHSRRP